MDTSAGSVNYFSEEEGSEDKMECAAWLDAIDGKGELVVKPEQAFIVTKILDAVYKSAKVGKQIVFE